MANDVSGQPGEAPASAASDESLEQGTSAQQPEQLTEEARKEQEAKDTEAKYRTWAREEAVRVSQSLVDKASNRIQQQVQEKIAALEMSKDVLGLTPEQVDAARQKIAIDAMTARPEPPASGAALDGQDQEPPVVGWARAQMEQAGVQIIDGDPELATIEPAIKSGDQYAFAAALKTAIEAKKARLASQTEGAKRRTAPPSGGTASKKPMTADEKMRIGLEGPWDTPPK